MQSSTFETRLTVAKAVPLAECHESTIYRALEDGTLHGTQRVKGGRWLIRESCLEAWLDGVPCAHRAATSELVDLNAHRSSGRAS